MAGQITIRQLADSDWPIYSALRLEALRDSPKAFGGSLAEEGNYKPQEWMDWLKPYRQSLFALFDGGKPIGLTGLMTAREDSTVGHFIASYIKPEHRRRGLSDLFFEARLKQALDYIPWKKVTVCHRESNEVARRAILRHGFVLVHCVSVPWPDGMIDNRYDYELNLEDMRRKKFDRNNCLSGFLENGRT